MRAALLLTLAVLLGSPVFSQDAPPPADQPSATPPPPEQIVDVATITGYPRTVASVAQLWFTLFQACQQAGVPPSSVIIANPQAEGKLTGWTPSIIPELDSRGQGAANEALVARDYSTWLAADTDSFCQLAPVLAGLCGKLVAASPSGRDWATLGRDDRGGVALVFGYWYAWPGTGALASSSVPSVLFDGRAFSRDLLTAPHTSGAGDWHRFYLVLTARVPSGYQVSKLLDCWNAVQEAGKPIQAAKP